MQTSNLNPMGLYMVTLSVLIRTFKQILNGVAFSQKSLVITIPAQVI
nr:MAG TPA: hypothetical protein [Caudoviricetes sp.]